MTTKYVSGNRNTSNPNDPNSFCLYKRPMVYHRAVPRDPLENVAGRITSRSFPGTPDAYHRNSGPGTSPKNLPLLRDVNYLIGNGPGTSYPSYYVNGGVNVSLAAINHPIYQVWQNEYNPLYIQGYQYNLQNMGVGTPHFTGPLEIPLRDPNNIFNALYNPVMQLWSYKSRGMPLDRITSQQASLEYLSIKGEGVFNGLSIDIQLPEIMFLPMRTPNGASVAHSPYKTTRTVRNFGGIDSYASYTPRGDTSPRRPCTLTTKFQCKPITLWEPIFDRNIGPIGNGTLFCYVMETASNSVNIVDAFSMHTSQIARPWGEDMNEQGQPPVWYGIFSYGVISSTCRVITASPSITVTDPEWYTSNERLGNKNYIELGDGEFYTLTFDILYVPDNSPNPGVDKFLATYEINLYPSTESFWGLPAPAYDYYP